MTSVFLEGWRERTQRAEAATDPPAFALRRGAGSAALPLVISPQGDPTARWFWEASRRRGRGVAWLTFEDILDSRIGGNALHAFLHEASGVYLREDWRGSEPRARANALVRALSESHPNVIRPETGSSNWCKPLHVARLAAARGRAIRVPPSALQLRQPIAAGSVLKNCSARPTFVLDADTVAAEVSDPLLVQERIRGRELRVHVLEDRCFAAAVETDALDYRRAGASIRPAEIDPDLAAELVALRRAEGLRFCGVDLILSDDAAYVIEVNPMPGYHSFEPRDGPTPITDHLYRTLCQTGAAHEVRTHR